MRVLYWSELFWPAIGGAEVQGMRLMSGLREYGHQVLVVTDSQLDELPRSSERNGLDIVRFPFQQALAEGSPEHVFDCLERVLRVVRVHDPDVVHIGLAGPSTLFALEVVRRFPVPLVVTQQASKYAPDAANADNVMAHVLARADRIVCCSRAMCAETLERSVVRPRSLEVVHNGIADPDTDRQPLPWQPPRLMGVGRFSHEKGFDVLIEAFARLAPEHPALDLELIGDGPELSALERLAQRLSVRDRIQFSGWSPPESVPAALNRATVVVVPSHAEAFGLVAAEAQLMGRPVVATRVGGLPEVVRDAETGLLVDAADASALAKALADLLARPSDAERMGEAGAKRARRMFGLDRMIARYDEIYREVVKEEIDAAIEPVATEHG